MSVKFGDITLNARRYQWVFDRFSHLIHVTYLKSELTVVGFIVVGAQIYWCGGGCSAAGLKINDKFKSLILLQVAPCDTNRKMPPHGLLWICARFKH